MKIELLAAYLEANGAGVIGETIFAHRMEADVPQGILIRMPLTGMPIDHELPGYYHHPFQVIVRAPTQPAGDQLAEQLIALLTMHRREFRDSNNVLKMTVSQMLPLHRPIVYPRSQEGHDIEWSINFDAAYVLH